MVFAAIGSLFGGGSKAQPSRQETGYQTLFDLFGDFAEEELPQDLQDIYRMPRPQPLFAPLSIEERADPDFAPRALMAMEDYLAAGQPSTVGSYFGEFTALPTGQASPQAAQQAAQQAQAARSLADYQNMITAQNLLNQMQAARGGQGRRLRPLSELSQEDINYLAEMAPGALVGGGTQAGNILTAEGIPIDLTRFYA
jgi:hypothetical protein